MKLLEIILLQHQEEKQTSKFVFLCYTFIIGWCDKMAKKIVKKGTTKKVKEQKVINISLKRAIGIAIETAVIYGGLISWIIASLLIETKVIESDVSTTSLMFIFFPVLLLIIGAIDGTFLFLCSADMKIEKRTK